MIRKRENNEKFSDKPVEHPVAYRTSAYMRIKQT